MVALVALLSAGILGYAVGRSWPRWMIVGCLGVTTLSIAMVIAFPYSNMVLIIRLLGVAAFGGYCYRRGLVDANRSNA